MIDEAKYAAVYGILMLGLIAEVLIAVDGSALGTFAGPAILAIASLQAIFIFLVYMHGRYGPRPVAVFAVISLLTVLPLFIALLCSVVMPHHGSLQMGMRTLANKPLRADVAAGILAGATGLLVIVMIWPTLVFPAPIALGRGSTLT